MSSINNLQGECPVIYSLGIVSKKWVLNVICELKHAHGPMRYSELKRNVPGVTNMALSQVLKDLVGRGLVIRKQFNEVPPHTEYELSDTGQQLITSCYGLAKWACGQMQENQMICDRANGCYALHYEYLPAEKEEEVHDSFMRYNDGYEEAIAEINKEDETNALIKLEQFLVAMLDILTREGEDETRWTLTYFFRPDTPEILSQSRPQYRIMTDLITEGQQEGIITTSVDASYLADELSKVITGMIGEWLMAKCGYDIMEYNRPMLHMIIKGLVV